MSDSIKAWLYRRLGLKKYLQLLQTLYLAGYKTSVLKLNKKYRWHYFVKELVQPSDTIIDIGANLGYFSYVFSRVINNDGALYSIEPVKPYRELLMNILPDQKNIVVYAFALGNTNEGSVKLGMPPMLRHLHYLRHGTVTILDAKNITDNQLIFESEIRRGSEVFANLPKLDYVKCDIEGYETVVLPELKPVLQKHLPLVQLETWGEQLPQMLSFFSSINFKAYHLSNGKLIPCDQLSVGEIASSDILFVPEARIKIIEKYL